MNKDIDYQINPVMSLYKPSIQTSRQVKVATTRVASTATSFVSFLATQGAKKKTLGTEDILRAIQKLPFPDMLQKAQQFMEQLDQEPLAQKKTAEEEQADEQNQEE